MAIKKIKEELSKNWTAVFGGILGVLGITTLSINKFLIEIIQYKITISVWQLCAFISLFLSVYLLIRYFYLRKTNTCQFDMGSMVILKTDQLPIYVVSDFKPLKNEVLCVYNKDGVHTERWIKQGALKIYEYTPNPNPRPPKKSPNFW